MKLIDADARIEEEFYDEEFEEWSLKTCTIEEYLNYISEMPPIIDAVPVVRCKNCQYTDEPIDEEGEHDYWCVKHGSYVYEDDYCSYGER